MAKKKDFKLAQFQKYTDKRGDLIVFLRASELKPGMKKFGQIYFVTFNKKGVVRGNHYHKKWYEWFGIVSGKVKVVLENVVTKERKELILDAKDHQYVRLEIGPNVAHAFKSLTTSAALINYAFSEWQREDGHPYILM